MRNKIVIFSHNTHSFLKNEIFYASEVFDKVFVICPFNKEIESSVTDLPNVEIYSYTKCDLYINTIKSVINIFEQEKREELVENFNNKDITYTYLKNFFNFLALSKIFNKLLEKKLKITVNDSKNWVFYSAWYFGTAYSVTHARNKYKDVKTVSLAHSFEVDELKSPFTKVLFRKKYHQKLDKVSFISGNVYKMYLETVAKPLGLKVNHNEVRYLGTRKLSKGTTGFSQDGTFRIVSCSNVVPIKRVEKIFESLEIIENVNIEWIHFGDGSQMNNLKKIISNKKNSNLKISLLGSIENVEIHEFYATNNIDLFINTSASEGIPVTIMEAIAYGIPVIATDVGGNSEIVEEEFGRLVSQDAKAYEIKEAILSIYNLTTIEKVEMQKNAIEYFNKNFNSDYLRNTFFLDLMNDKKN